MLKWFYAMREKLIPVSGPIIKEKALQLTATHAISDLRASNGWLHHFRQQNDIVFKQL